MNELISFIILYACIKQLNIEIKEYEFAIKYNDAFTRYYNSTGYYVSNLNYQIDIMLEHSD